MCATFLANYFIKTKFRSRSTLSLASCPFYLINVLVLVLVHVIYITYIHILYVAFLECFTTSLHMFFSFRTVTVLAWRNTFVSQLHTSINYIIAEWIVTATPTITTHPIIIPIICFHAAHAETKNVTCEL